MAGVSATRIPADFPQYCFCGVTASHYFSADRQWSKRVNAGPHEVEGYCKLHGFMFELIANNPYWQKQQADWLKEQTHKREMLKGGDEAHA